ncbi:hypothetical protein BLNAU_2329 [Blattamonas nauphoetae]|uniref:Uncharacterized protein n=1 Tax=Blattamonas nauphoetae TaxID=2049346 RepID=A0ABQ9YFF7_9EUKA|nr:hypothetical protein BLNAU_2329 [Blattamonas nauphoetae]
MKRTRLLVEDDLETDASFIHYYIHSSHVWFLSEDSLFSESGQASTKGVIIHRPNLRRKERNIRREETLSLRLPNLEEHSRSLDTTLASSLCSHTLQSLTKTNIDRIVYPIHSIDLFISGNINKTNVVEQKRRAL